MESAGTDEVLKHVRVYLAVFAALLVLTVVTVLAAYLDVSTPVAVILALIIASFKASLVASCFMHLMSEKMTIYGILILSVIFFIVMLLIPVLSGSEILVSEHVS